MARVTVEDCIEKIPNRFGLVLMAAHRARAISAGSSLLVDRDNDKNPVVALREIADDVVDSAGLRESLIGTLQRVDERILRLFSAAQLLQPGSGHQGQLGAVWVVLDVLLRDGGQALPVTKLPLGAGAVQQGLVIGYWGRGVGIGGSAGTRCRALQLGGGLCCGGCAG